MGTNLALCQAHSKISALSYGWYYTRHQQRAQYTYKSRALKSITKGKKEHYIAGKDYFLLAKNSVALSKESECWANVRRAPQNQNKIWKLQKPRMETPVLEKARDPNSRT